MACYGHGKNPGVKQFKASGTRRNKMESGYSAKSQESSHNSGHERPVKQMRDPYVKKGY